MKIKNNTPFQVIVNGQTFDARVENVAANPLVVTVNGNRYTVELVQEEVPATVLTSPVVSTPAATAAPASPPLQVRPTAAAPEGAFSITAPMPGTIQGVCVKVGQSVKTGDQLCLLEAMKMKNAIRSPREGVIASIDVSDEKKVTYGELLFTMK